MFKHHTALQASASSIIRLRWTSFPLCSAESQRQSKFQVRSRLSRELAGSLEWGKTLAQAQPTEHGPRGNTSPRCGIRGSRGRREERVRASAPAREERRMCHGIIRSARALRFEKCARRALKCTRWPLLCFQQQVQTCAPSENFCAGSLVRAAF